MYCSQSQSHNNMMQPTSLSLRSDLSTWKANAWPTAFVFPQQPYPIFLMVLCQASHPPVPPHPYSIIICVPGQVTSYLLGKLLGGQVVASVIVSHRQCCLSSAVSSTEYSTVWVRVQQ